MESQNPYPVYCVNCRRSLRESDVYCPYCKQDQRPGAPDINEVKRRQQTAQQAAQGAKQAQPPNEQAVSWKTQQEAIAAKQAQQAKPIQEPIITPPPPQARLQVPQAPAQIPPVRSGISCSNVVMGVLGVIVLIALFSPSYLSDTPSSINKTHTAGSPSGINSRPNVNTQPQPTPWLLSETPPTPPAPPQHVANISGAWVMTCEYVRAKLKSPHSAQFPYSSEPGVVVNEISPDSYTVRGYVDSQNSFGAMLRTWFTCILKENISSDNWTIIAFEFDE